MAITGIDISSNNAGYRQIDTTDLSFCIVKLTQGTTYTNPLAHDQIAWAGTWAKHIGVYAWVEPWRDPHEQASYFAAEASKYQAAFWALDCEDPARAESDAVWQSCVTSMRDDLVQKLGPKHLIYVGRYFHGAALLPIAEGHWWLPDYGKNDGREHALPAGVSPILHQYTSVGGLDRNIVLDERAWAALVGPSAPPVPPVIVPPSSEATLFLVQEKGSQTVHAIGAGPNGITDITAANLPAWQGALIGSTGRKEAGNVWPVEVGFVDNVRKGS